MLEQSNSSTVGLTPWPQGQSPRPSALRHALNGKSTLADASLVDDDGEEDTTVTNMQRWRNDAMSQHLYSTAAFWGGKAFTMTSASARSCPGCDSCPADDPNDAFWLAQIYFLTHQYARAETLLVKPRTSASPEDSFMPPVASTSKLPAAANRLVDVSVACRYLAAQCMVRQAKWSDALELLGDVNPFRGTRSSGPTVRGSDGGIKVRRESSTVSKHLTWDRAVRSFALPPTRPHPPAPQRNGSSQGVLPRGTQSRRQVLRELRGPRRRQYDADRGGCA